MNSKKEQLYQAALMELGVAFAQLAKIIDRKSLTAVEVGEVSKARALAMNSHNTVQQILSNHLDDGFINTINNPNTDDVKRILKGGADK